MADTKTGQYTGTMEAGTVLYQGKQKRFYPINNPYKSFYISYLAMDEKRFGYGSKFLKFARNESKEHGCEGRIHLIASRVFSQYDPPHIFYRKSGFTAGNNKMNKYLDKCIKANIQISWDKSDNLPMYFPLQAKPEKIISLIKKIFHKALLELNKSKYVKK